MILASLLALAAVRAPAPPPACTPASSIRTSVTAIARNPGRFMGRCVTVSGPSSATALFSGVDGIYLGQWPSVFDGTVGARHRIGLYSESNRLRAARLSTGGPAHLTVTGRVDSCELMQNRLRAASRQRGDAIIIPMMGGYCHWFGGPVIQLASYTHDPAVRYERLTGEAARTRVGDLVAATARTPGLAALQAFAREFADAIRRGDRAALAALHDFGTDLRGDDDRRVLAYLLEMPDSPFAEMRRGADPGVAIFVRRNASIERDVEVSGVLCFCRAGHCGDNWPISIIDAANGPDKPYACTIVEPRNWEPRRGGLHTYVNAAWLLEPARTASRR